MNSTTSSPKRFDKVSSDSFALGFDLLTNLTYMSVLSIGNLPRHRILERCGQQGLKTAVFFSYVVQLAERMGIEYTKAFQMVSERAKATNIKSLLLRFAASISSGESESEFVCQEAQTEAERYSNQYERGIENLRKWTDAYSAILISVTLIMVVSLVSTMMGSINQGFTIIMAFTLVGITSTGLYVIFKVAPVEQVFFSPPEIIPKNRRKARILAFSLLPLGLVVALLVAPGLGLKAGASVIYLSIGASLLPAAFYAVKDGASITKLDSELPTFWRSLGNVAGATGFTIGQALNKLDVRSMGSLAPHIRNLQVRMAAMLPTHDCWQRFQDEMGSELASRTTHMMIDGTELGGRADQVGNICSSFAQTVVNLRAKRQLTASTFSFLTVPMHATTTFILVFVLEIISNFSTNLSAVSSGLPSQDTSGLAVRSAAELTGGLNIYGAQDLGAITLTILFVTAVLTLANSLAPKLAGGGSNLKILPYVCIMCLLSGAIVGVVPLITAQIFSR